MIDDTHDPSVRSWVESAAGHAEFPLQNLPFGVFSPPGGSPRAGVAIGGRILDLGALADAGLSPPTHIAGATTLNALLADPPARKALRRRLHALLRHDAAERARIAPLLHDAGACTLHLPCAIGDYSDFYAGIQHATNTGSMLRPDMPLTPNYKHLPIAYHGRASSIRASGTPVHRPAGQRKPARDTAPSFGPSRALDYELELGVWIGPGNTLGTPIPIGQAAGHIAGFCLLNDWSARDIQGWETQPLGPFLGKSFLTTLSPWVVTPEALAPFRVAPRARPDVDPVPLPYLLDAEDQAGGALDLTLTVALQTAAMRDRDLPPHELSHVNSQELYWTIAQLVTQQASNGCDLRPGDLLGSGTISGAAPDSFGSLLEIGRGGRAPLILPGGETRRFLEDGDEVLFAARATRDGFAPIGFGECRGRVVAA